MQLKSVTMAVKNQSYTNRNSCLYIYNMGCCAWLSYSTGVHIGTDEFVPLCISRVSCTLWFLLVNGVDTLCKRESVSMMP